MCLITIIYLAQVNRQTEGEKQKPTDTSARGEFEMQVRQCKYVNVCVFFSSLAFLILAFFFFYFCLLMRRLCHHMWSPFHQAEVHWGPSAGASTLNNATQKALGIFADTFDIMG